VLPESATPPLELELDELELLLELDELELLLELDELELLLELDELELLLELDELELLLELDELALTLKSGVSSASALAIGVKLRVPGGRRASGARTTAIHQPLNFMGVSLAPRTRPASSPGLALAASGSHGRARWGDGPVVPGREWGSTGPQRYLRDRLPSVTRSRKARR